MSAINVGLLGFGTIGTGVARVFENNSEIIHQRLGKELKLVKIADLDITTDRGVTLDTGMLTTDVEEVISNPDIDVVIELIGGYEPAKSFILKAIEQGKHIVTANKALMALHGQEIIEAANRNNVNVMFEAAVGGGIPVISAIKENLCANKFQSVLGILNGTCNFILTKMTDKGSDFAPVLKEAQDLAMPRPTRPLILKVLILPIRFLCCQRSVLEPGSISIRFILKGSLKSQLLISSLPDRWVIRSNCWRSVKSW